MSAQAQGKDRASTDEIIPEMLSEEIWSKIEQLSKKIAEITERLSEVDRELARLREQLFSQAKGGS